MTTEQAISYAFIILVTVITLTLTWRYLRKFEPTQEPTAEPAEVREVKHRKKRSRTKYYNFNRRIWRHSR